MQNTWIHNSKAKEELLIKHTDIHWVYRYSDLDMDRLNQSPLYEYIETRSWNEFRDQEAMDSKESINRYDLFIPEWIDLNNYDWNIVVCTRKNQLQQEDIFDLFLMSNKAIDFIRSFWKENMSEYLKDNLNIEAEKLENIDQERFGELQISLIVQDWFCNYTWSTTFYKRKPIYEYIQNKILQKIKFRDKGTCSNIEMQWYNSLHIFLYRKISNCLQLLEKDYENQKWGQITYDDFERKRNSDEWNYDSPFIKFSITKITEAISDYFKQKTT
jgi:hypothetical protein